jgi:hypothetical protein
LKLQSSVHTSKHDYVQKAKQDVKVYAAASANPAATQMTDFDSQISMLWPTQPATSVQSVLLSELAS